LDGVRPCPAYGRTARACRRAAQRTSSATILFAELNWYFNPDRVRWQAHFVAAGLVRHHKIRPPC
jgi:hypothetical protein